MKRPPAPGTTCPRQPSVLDHVHRCTYRMSGCLVAPTPYWLMIEASQSPRRLARKHERGEAEANRECGVVPNPFASSQPHPTSYPNARLRSNGTSSRKT